MEGRGGGDPAVWRNAVLGPFLNPDAGPFLVDLRGRAAACLRTIDTCEAALGEMRTTLADLGAVQSAQTDTALSLVGTMFLPLTFIAGVFGMNFAYEGRPGAGIALLNDEYGALYFWWICGGVVGLLAALYHLKGWTDSGFFSHAHARPYQADDAAAAAALDMFRTDHGSSRQGLGGGGGGSFRALARDDDGGGGGSGELQGLAPVLPAQRRRLFHSAAATGAAAAAAAAAAPRVQRWCRPLLTGLLVLLWALAPYAFPALSKRNPDPNYAPF